MVMSFPLTAAGQFRSFTGFPLTALKPRMGFLGTSTYDTRLRTIAFTQRGCMCTIVRNERERPFTVLSEPARSGAGQRRHQSSRAGGRGHVDGSPH